MRRGLPRASLAMEQVRKGHQRRRQQLQTPRLRPEGTGLLRAAWSPPGTASRSRLRCSGPARPAPAAPPREEPQTCPAGPVKGQGVTGFRGWTAGGSPQGRQDPAGDPQARESGAPRPRSGLRVGRAWAAGASIVRFRRLGRSAQDQAEPVSRSRLRPDACSTRGAWRCASFR